MMKITMAAAAIILAADNTKAQLPDGVRALVNAYDHTKFVEETGSLDGATIFWRFIVSNPTDKSAVIVTVPSNITPDHFGAHLTAALDAVHYFAKGEIPTGGYTITARVPLIEQILAVSGNHFLGVFPNMDHTQSRWLFYVEGAGDNPAVVVNIAPNNEVIGQFNNLYWTALDAVRCYILARKSQPSQQHQSQQHQTNV